MPSYFSLCLLAFAVSLDNFGAGLTYGLRRIRIPLVSVIIIACCSGGVIYGSMLIGANLLHVLPEAAARSFGAVILIGIGSWAIVQMIRSRRSEERKQAADDAQQEQEAQQAADDAQQEQEAQQAAAAVERTLLHIEIRTFGLVIDILRTPSTADLDRSGSISPAEAALLGLALSLDACGAGIGAALLGFPPLATALSIALSSGLFLAGGMRIGRLLAGTAWVRKLSWLPGCILIIMGIMRLF